MEGTNREGNNAEVSAKKHENLEQTSVAFCSMSL